MYSVDFSTILNLAFKFIQNDNNHFHLSTIRINTQKAINYAVIKMKKNYDNHH